MSMLNAILDAARSKEAKLKSAHNRYLQLLQDQDPTPAKVREMLEKLEFLGKDAGHASIDTEHLNQLKSLHAGAIKGVGVHAALIEHRKAMEDHQAETRKMIKEREASFHALISKEEDLKTTYGNASTSIQQYNALRESRPDLATATEPLNFQMLAP